MKKKRKSTEILCGTVFICLLTILDQITKSLAIGHLKAQDAVVLLPGILELDYLENQGMAFGMLEGKRILFLFFFVLFFLAMVYCLWKMPFQKKYVPLRFFLILMASGALGNFLDRLFRGYVVDFISFCLIHFPIFNLADVFVVCGGIGLVFLLFFYYDEKDLTFLQF